MSISNLFPEKVIHDGGFGTNGAAVNQLNVRSVNTTHFNLALTKVGGVVNCIIPQFQVVSYLAGATPQAWTTVNPLPEEFRPEHLVTYNAYYALGSAPTLPVPITINVFSTGFITFCTNPINITLGTSLDANSYLVNDVALSWQVSE